MSSAVKAWTELCTRWRRFQRSLREVGVLYTCQNIVKTVFPGRVLAANTAFVAEVDISRWPDSIAPDPCIRWAIPSDTEMFARAGVPIGAIQAYIARGARVAIYERNAEVLGFFIYDADCVELYDWIRFRLSPDVKWNAEAWVAPAHRGKGMHGRIRHFAVSEFCRNGYVRTLATIDAANIPSLRATIKKGAIIGCISYVRILGLTLVRINGAIRVGLWGPKHRLDLTSDMFKSDLAQPYGPTLQKRVQRLLD